MENLINKTEEKEEEFSIKKVIDTKTDEVLSTLSGKGNNAIKKVLNNVLVFMSPSGGTGASTIVSTLAFEMKKKGLSVMVIDLNVLFPSQHVYFNIEQKINKKDLVSFLSGKNTLGDSIEYRESIGTLVSNNRSVTDYISNDTEFASMAMVEAIDRLSYLFDVVLIDCQKDLTFDVVSTTLYKADTIYFVIDDGVQSLINIPKLKNNFEITGVHTQKIKYIMNKRTSVYYPKANLEALKIKLEEIVPFEIGVIESGLRGEVFTKKGEAKSKTSSEYVFAIKRLADKVLENGGYKHE